MPGLFVIWQKTAQLLSAEDKYMEEQAAAAYEKALDKTAPNAVYLKVEKPGTNA